MTDKEKIKAEIERLKSIADYQLDNCKVDKSAWSQQAEVCKKLLSFINSMPEEPFKENRTSYDIGFYSGYKKCKEDYKAKERACKPIDDSDISCNAELCFAITGCKYYNSNKKSNVINFGTTTRVAVLSCLTDGSLRWMIYMPLPATLQSGRRSRLLERLASGLGHIGMTISLSLFLNTITVVLVI